MEANPTTDLIKTREIRLAIQFHTILFPAFLNPQEKKKIFDF